MSLFKCKPLGTVLSRSACGARYDRRIGQQCATCAVGRQHARGALPDEWPDGTRLEAAAVTVRTMATLRVHLAVIAAHTPAPTRGRVIAGATIREHARQLGVHPQVVRQRLVRGASVEAALDMTPRRTDPRARSVVWRGVEMSVHALARTLGCSRTNLRRKLARGIRPDELDVQGAP